jgi:hypothetical protein
VQCFSGRHTSEPRQGDHRGSRTNDVHGGCSGNVFVPSPSNLIMSVMLLSMRRKRCAAAHEHEKSPAAVSCQAFPLPSLKRQISSVAAASTIPVTSAAVQANSRMSSRTLVMVRSPCTAPPHALSGNALLYLGKMVTAPAPKENGAEMNFRATSASSNRSRFFVNTVGTHTASSTPSPTNQR